LPDHFGLNVLVTEEAPRQRALVTVMLLAATCDSVAADHIAQSESRPLPAGIALAVGLAKLLCRLHDLLASFVLITRQRRPSQFQLLLRHKTQIVIAAKGFDPSARCLHNLQCSDGSKDLSRMENSVASRSKSASSKETKKKQKQAIRLQYGALPYRISALGELEILLVTTRQSGRWIIPKGSPIKGLKATASAAQEAYEEAGVRGIVKTRPIGKFCFDKNLEEGVAIPCEVSVFALYVTNQYDSWPEQAQRTSRWFPPGEALAQLTDEGLITLVSHFIDRVAAKEPKLAAKKKRKSVR